MSEKEITTDNGGSAFPTTGFDSPNHGWQHGQEGMTLRDYFAAAALTGEVGGEDFGGELAQLRSHENARLMARRAYMLADAMLAARKEGNQS
jgi:hypothetical protein